MQRSLVNQVKKFKKITNFQKQCYLALLKIPKGKITTYKKLAEKINNPKAARAVGNAMNKNPFAPIVPCHRVISSDGSIGGFARGIKAKIKLLQQEGLTIIDNKIVNKKDFLI